MKKYLITVMVTSIVIASLVTGCGGEGDTETKPEGKYGGVLKMTVSEPYSIGYPGTMTGQTDGQTSMRACETLFRYDEEANMVPLLATKWEADPAAMTITVELRKGIKFTDGSDFDASVCKWNLDQYRSGARPELNKVESVEVVNDYTVRLNLTEFDNTIINALCNGADAGRMISQKAYEENGQEWCEQNPVGTGPFKFVSRTKDVEIIWEKNKDYWDGEPYLDGHHQLRIADATVALMSFKNGELHIHGTNPTEGKNLEATGLYNKVIPPEGQVPALAGAANDPYFSKLKVRQAMAYAIDVESLNAAFGQGDWKIQNQWAVPGTWGYNPDVKGYPYDPDKARELLAEAGYPDGFDTVLHFYNTGGVQMDENVAIQAYLKDVGIRAELDPMLRPAFADVASNMKGFTGIVRQQGFSLVDPLQKYAGVAAGQEFAGVVLPQKFLDIYAQATAAPDFNKKQELVHELMKIATDEYCIATHLYVQTSPIFKSKLLHDDLYGVVPYRYVSPWAWLDTE